MLTRLAWIPISIVHTPIPPAHAQIPGRKFQRTNIVAAQMGSEILAPMQYAGSTDAVLFETWFEKCLLPCLPEDAVIVMDSAAFHHKK